MASSGILMTAIFSAYLLISCKALEFSPSSNTETLRNVVRTGPRIVVGSSNALYRINPATLEVDERFPISTENRLLVADDGGTYDGNILSCDSDACFLAEVDNFANMSWYVQADTDFIRNSDENIVAILAPNMNGNTEVIFGEAPNTNRAGARRFTKGRLTNANGIVRPLVKTSFN